MPIVIDKQDLKVCIANWETSKEILSDIRYKVFVEEQKVPEELEWDGFDETSIHYTATYKNIIIAVARLKPDGQLGRMAVLKKYRNQGIGSELLKYILEIVGHAERTKIYLHAQVSAISFYKNLGFVEEGKIFHEAHIAHCKMTLEN